MIELQATKTPNRAGSWTDVAQVTVTAKGRFSGRWKPSVGGRTALRAQLLPPSDSSASRQARATAGGRSADRETVLQTATLTIVVFRSAEATLYGPGLWGNKTACGEKLKRNMIGVANRHLKCGTRVGIDYDGRELVVPVIDRGPYGTAARWDLTMATAKKLGITSTTTIATIAPVRR